MIRLIKFLFTGDWHLHKWKIIQEVSLVEGNLNANVIPHATRRYLQCEHCGKIKVHEP